MNDSLEFLFFFQKYDRYLRKTDTWTANRKICGFKTSWFEWTAYSLKWYDETFESIIEHCRQRYIPIREEFAMAQVHNFRWNRSPFQWQRNFPRLTWNLSPPIPVIQKLEVSSGYSTPVLIAPVILAKSYSIGTTKKYMKLSLVKHLNKEWLTFSGSQQSRTLFFSGFTVAT